MLQVKSSNFNRNRCNFEFHIRGEKVLSSDLFTATLLIMDPFFCLLNFAYILRMWPHVNIDCHPSWKKKKDNATTAAQNHVVRNGRRKRDSLLKKFYRYIITMNYLRHHDNHVAKMWYVTYFCSYIFIFHSKYYVDPYMHLHISFPKYSGFLMWLFNNTSQNRYFVLPAY